MLLAGGGIALAVPARAKPRWDAIVSHRRKGAVATLGAALALAAKAEGRPFAIQIDEGVFEEKVTIHVPNVTIEGRGPRSVLSYGAASGHKRPDGGNWGTSGSGSLTIEAPGVTLRNLTVRNSFDYIGNRTAAVPVSAQAVALAIGRGADRTLVDRCAIEGFQDTLLVQSRSSFRDCRISGNVDFIFGGGVALFRRCEIVTRHVPGAVGGGYVAAPSTPQAQPFGFVFSQCRVVREAGVPDASVYLGRPWQAGGNKTLIGATAYLDCWLDRHIARDGWTSMGGFQPWNARLFEYDSRGPGAGPASKARRLLDAQQARQYAADAVLGGWTP